MLARVCLRTGSLVNKLSRLKNENKGLWSAIKQFFENLFNKIDKLYRGLKPDSAEGKYIANMRKTAKKLKAAFAEGLTAASKNKKPSTSTQKTTQLMYSGRETLEAAAKSIATISNDEYFEAKKKAPFVLVMEHTPKILLDSLKGSKDRRVLIRRDALYLAIRESGIQEGHYHGLGAEVLSDLPKYLEDPDVILSTKTENGEENQSRRLLLTHIPVKNGQSIISVEFESIKDFEGKNDYFNLVVTVFDLHENYLKRLFKKNSATIKYKKENLTQVNPQLYEWLRTINAKSSSNSISHLEQNVNSKKWKISSCLLGQKT